MTADKALTHYLRLRHRRDHLARLSRSKGITRETFTDAEMEQMKICETELNRLRGGAAIELLLRNKSTIFSYIK